MIYVQIITFIIQVDFEVPRHLIYFACSYPETLGCPWCCCHTCIGLHKLHFIFLPLTLLISLRFQRVVSPRGFVHESKSCIGVRILKNRRPSVVSWQLLDGGKIFCKKFQNIILINQDLKQERIAMLRQLKSIRSQIRRSDTQIIAPQAKNLRLFH